MARHNWGMKGVMNRYEESEYNSERWWKIFFKTSWKHGEYSRKTRVTRIKYENCNLPHLKIEKDEKICEHVNRLRKNWIPFVCIYHKHSQ